MKMLLVPEPSVFLLKRVVREYLNMRGICPECEADFDVQHQKRCKIGKVLDEIYVETEIWK